jgi:hypothetical protein
MVGGMMDMRLRGVVYYLPCIAVAYALSTFAK